MDGLPTIETARRLLRSHGIDDAQLEAAAKEQQRRWLAEWEAANPNANYALTDVGEAAVWLTGSVKQLQRHWGGRCISCVHWEPEYAKLSPSSGECGVLHLDETNPLINVIQNVPRAAVTTAPFGCICWGEIPADDAETLRARAELAMAIGLLPTMPEGE